MLLTIGSEGNSVRELQTRLTEEGFSPGTIDGSFGELTRRAVVCYQQSKKLADDCIAGPITLKALGIKVDVIKIEKERSRFRSLLLSNPNYFGNLKVSKYKPVKVINKKTTYEQLMCIGYNPPLEQLEAVVHIKKDSGYGTNLCGNGTREYVRFFVDWNNNGTWVDVGMTYFVAHNLSGNKPLEYSVTLNIDPSHKFCNFEHLPNVRAILSWDDPPTPNDPNFTPVWGNTMEAQIQIEPYKLIPLKQLIAIKDVVIPQSILQNLDLNQPLATLQEIPLSIGELAAMYKDQAVPAHRFGFESVQQHMSKSTSMALSDLGKPIPVIESFAELGIDLAEIIDILIKTDGNTDYEELNCLGYNQERKHLTATIKVKKPGGYSGNLCKKGSSEYIAFWNWDTSSSSWVHLGTSVLNVHDISSIPTDGLHYAVSLPVDLSKYRKPCSTGSMQLRIRAIMSWQTPPPPTNPNWVPTWGNREETLIQLKPGAVSTGLQIPYIESAGNMSVCEINQSTGLATGEGLVAYFFADRAPFARTVTITGSIDNPPIGYMEGGTPLKYKIEVRPFNLLNPQPWQTVDNQFKVWVRDDIFPNPTIQKKITQKVDGDGFYDYLEDPGGSSRRRYVVPVLAKWPTTKNDNGKWQIRITAKTPANALIPGGIQWCEDGTTRSSVKLLLDNESPDPTIALTGVQVGGVGPIQPAVECGKFNVDDIIHGTYSVTDDHFGALTLSVIPSGPANGATVNPSIRSFDIVPTTGESGNWSLDTSGMDPCGYVVRLWTRDRAIVNSGSIGLRDHDDLGFCLEPKAKKAK